MNVSSVEQNNPRLQYIDTAKGILILFLLYGHSTLYTRMLGYEDDSMSLWGKFIPWYNAFFMPAFFIITGFCSSYIIEFKEYLWKNVKTLLIPAIVIVTTYHYINDLVLHNDISFQHLTDLRFWLIDKGPWFIFALFWCKILFWLLYNKLSMKKQVLVVGLLYLLGLIETNIDFIPNVQSHLHALLLLPYLAFGAYLKNNKDILDKYLKPIALFGGISITVQWILSVMGVGPLPSIDAYIGVSEKTFPIHIINSISGTAFVVYVSKLIGSSSFLQTLGKGTLLLYLGNGLFQTIATKLAYSMIPATTYLSCLVIHLVAYLLCIGIGYVAVKIIYGTKYLRWIVGKW